MKHERKEKKRKEYLVALRWKIKSSLATYLHVTDWDARLGRCHAAQGQAQKEAMRPKKTARNVP